MRELVCLMTYFDAQRDLSESPRKDRGEQQRNHETSQLELSGA